MTMPVEKRSMTVQEYYDRERVAEFKSDYFQGEIFAMAGGSVRHSQICTNLIGELRRILKGTDCRPFESNLRLLVQATGLRCYPDASVFCGTWQSDPDDPKADTLINPTIIFEVLSDSTEAYDRGTKSNHYRQIKSLKAYVLISQGAPHVEMYIRQPDNSWLFREYKGTATSAFVAEAKLELPLKEIYDGIDFPSPESVKL